MRDKRGEFTIANFQKNLNARARDLEKYGFGDKSIDVDGVYGSKTSDMFRRVAYYLGVSDKSIKNGATTYNRSIISNPKLRNLTQRKLSAKRLKSLQNNSENKSDALAVAFWAKSKAGISEISYNYSPEILKWQLEFGKWMRKQPYCGAFVGYGLRHIAGIMVPDGIVYTPSILNYAKSKTNGFIGFRGYSKAEVGDVALMRFGAHGDSVHHTGFVVHVDSNGNVWTVEGNTSKDSVGSQDNGDGVALKMRNKKDFVGFAVPNYKK